MNGKLKCVNILVYAIRGKDFCEEMKNNLLK
jgi:hypothetical protein